MSDNRTMTILVVEDEPLVRMMVADLLGELGYETVVAEDAKSALETLGARDDIDLLLTDVGLPKVDGWTLADSARQLRPTLPVLFATGYGQDPNRRLAPDMAVIVKPFDTQRLATTLHRLLEGGDRR